MDEIDIKEVTQISQGEAGAVCNNMAFGFRSQVDCGLINEFKEMKRFASLWEGRMLYL